MPDVMTPEQVAQYLQLNTDTVYRLIRSHKLVASKIGRNYRIPKENVGSLLSSTSNQQAVRTAQFKRVLDFAEKNNPGVNSDDVLEELERMDVAKKKKASGQL